jgi:hypothetical protein
MGLVMSHQHRTLCRVPSECGQDVADLIEQCCSANAAARPTAHDLIYFLARHLGRRLQRELSSSSSEEAAPLNPDQEEGPDQVIYPPHADNSELGGSSQDSDTYARARSFERALTRLNEQAWVRVSHPQGGRITSTIRSEARQSVAAGAENPPSTSQDVGAGTNLGEPDVDVDAPLGGS